MRLVREGSNADSDALPDFILDSNNHSHFVSKDDCLSQCSDAVGQVERIHTYGTGIALQEYENIYPNDQVDDEALTLYG